MVGKPNHRVTATWAATPVVATSIPLQHLTPSTLICPRDLRLCLDFLPTLIDQRFRRSVITPSTLIYLRGLRLCPHFSPALIDQRFRHWIILRLSDGWNQLRPRLVAWMAVERTDGPTTHLLEPGLQSLLALAQASAPGMSRQRSQA